MVFIGKSKRRRVSGCCVSNNSFKNLKGQDTLDKIDGHLDYDEYIHESMHNEYIHYKQDIQMDSKVTNTVSKENQKIWSSID